MPGGRIWGTCLDNVGPITLHRPGKIPLSWTDDPYLSLTYHCMGVFIQDCAPL